MAITLTLVVSEGEAQVLHRLRHQGEQEVLLLPRLVAIHSTQSPNELGGQRSKRSAVINRWVRVRVRVRVTPDPEASGELMSPSAACCYRVAAADVQVT